MVILVILVVLWTPYVVMNLLRAQRARTLSPVHPRTPCAGPRGGVQTRTTTLDGPAWTALDDRQLTRLLTDSAPRSAVKKDERP